MQPALERMLKRRRDRSIAIILTFKERECDEHLPDRTSKALRKIILDQFNEFCDVLQDIAASLDTGDVTLNEVYLERIDEIHQALLGERLPDKRKEIATVLDGEVT